MQLHRLAGAIGHGLGGLVFQQADFAHRRVALFDAPGEQFQHGLGRLDAHGHVGEFVAGDLLVDQLAAKHLALTRPGQRLVQADTGKTVGAGGEKDALAVEILHDGLEALVFHPHQVLHWHAAMVEIQGGGVGAPPAHFSQRRLRKAGRAFLDQQQRHAAWPRPASAHRHGVEVGAHAGGDERFRAVDDIVITIPARRGLEVGHVRAAGGFGDAECADLLAPQHRRQDALLQRLAAHVDDGRAADGVRQQTRQDTTSTATRQFLRGDDGHEQVAVVAAEGFRKTQAQQADFGRLAVQRDRKGLGFVPGIHVRTDFSGDEAAHRVAERQMLGRIEGTLGRQGFGRHAFYSPWMWRVSRVPSGARLNQAARPVTPTMRAWQPGRQRAQLPGPPRHRDGPAVDAPSSWLRAPPGVAPW